MRILHLNTEFWDSGLTEYSLSLAAEQNKKHDVAYAAGHDNYSLSAAKQLGIKTIKFHKKFGFFNLLLSTKEYNPDIINAHTGSAHSLAVLISLFMPKVKVVRTRADIRIMKLKPLSNFIWNNTDGFIAANTNILKQFKSLNIKNKKIKSEVIMQGVKEIKLPDVKKSDKKITVSILGRLDPIKGHKVLISAVKKVLEKYPEVELDSAGYEANIKISQLKEYAEKLGIKEKVKIRGFVEDKTEFISDCHIAVIASLGSEAVSRVALEWMSAKKPLIATRVGGIPDLIENEKTGLLIEPDNSEILAETIITLIENPNKKNQLAENAYKKYKENFTLEHFEKNTEKLYREVLRSE